MRTPGLKPMKMQMRLGARMSVSEGRWAYFDGGAYLLVWRRRFAGDAGDAGDGVPGSSASGSGLFRLLLRIGEVAVVAISPEVLLTCLNCSRLALKLAAEAMDAVVASISVLSSPCPSAIVSL